MPPFPKEPAIPAVDLTLQHDAIRDELQDAIRSVFGRQSFILGPEVSELEQEIARRHGCSYGIGCASGSDALLLSLMALGIGPGDRVLVPAFTFFATAGSVARLGAQPIFVDIDPGTFNISAAGVEEVLLSHPASQSVKAILPVHLYGQCAEMDRLMTLASERGLAMIEDAAQAVLARYRGRPAGSIGIAGCFSFYPTKNLGGAGDGGMITTNDAAFAKRLRLLRNHGSADKLHFPLVGINSRLDTLQAAILLVKLHHLEEWTRLRQRKAAYYRMLFLEKGLAAKDEVFPSEDAAIILPYEAPDMEHVYHQFTVRAHRRNELTRYLESHGIGTAVYYPVPLHRQPAFSELVPAAHCPQAERAAEEAVSLPMYPELTEAQQTRIVDQIAGFYRA